MKDKAATADGLPIYAEPRPAMRGPYLIRNPRAARLIGMLDALLAFRHRRCAQPSVPAQPRRILLADWTHLGNILLALPTLRFLRTTFPHAELGFVAGNWARQILEGTGLCDHLHVVDHFRMVRAPGDRLGKLRRYLAMRRQAVSELRALGYDIAIDLNAHFPAASPLFYAAGIPVRVGFTSGGFGPLLTHPVRWVQAPRPASDYPRDLLHALWPMLDMPAGALTPCYPGQPRSALPSELSARPYAVMHMGAGAPCKEWPEDNWAKVARALVDHGQRLILAGSGAREADRIRRVAAGFSPQRVTAAADQAWADYVALIAHAAHVICLDSSSAHIAAAFAVPTTAIYPGLNDLVQWGPCNLNARVLTTPVGCAPCYRNAGCAAMACIRGVTPQQVIDSVLSALEKADRAS